MGNDLGINKDAIQQQLISTVQEKVSGVASMFLPFISGGSAMLEKAMGFISSLIGSIFSKFSSSKEETTPPAAGKDDNKAAPHTETPEITPPSVPNLKAQARGK